MPPERFPLFPTPGWHPGKGLSAMREAALPVGMHTITRRLQTYKQSPGNINSFQHKENTIEQWKTLHLYLNHISFGYEWLTCSISGCLFRNKKKASMGIGRCSPPLLRLYPVSQLRVASCSSLQELPLVLLSVSYWVCFIFDIFHSLRFPFSCFCFCFLFLFVLTQYLPTAHFNVIADWKSLYLLKMRHQLIFHACSPSQMGVPWNALNAVTGWWDSFHYDSDQCSSVRNLEDLTELFPKACCILIPFYSFLIANLYVTCRHNIGKRVFTGCSCQSYKHRTQGAI